MELNNEGRGQEGELPVKHQGNFGDGIRLADARCADLIFLCYYCTRADWAVGPVHFRAEGVGSRPAVGT